MIFDDLIYGPVKSRRLGNSLGINLLPTNGKLCNFDCIYCECGFNKDHKSNNKLPVIEDVKLCFEKWIAKKKNEGVKIDSFTFAGNGEPTLHPQFKEIIEFFVDIRNKNFKETKISVLSNATQIHREEVAMALKMVDNNILKLDSALDDTLKLINKPSNKDFDVKTLTENIKKFQNSYILQTMFLKGVYKNQIIDNTTEKEVIAWLEFIEKTCPREIMIYTVERPTPAGDLQKADIAFLNRVGECVKKKGFPVNIAF